MKVLTNEKSTTLLPPIQYQNSLMFYLLGPSLTHFISKYFAEKKNKKEIQTLARNEFAKWRRYKHFNRKLKFLK